MQLVGKVKLNGLGALDLGQYSGTLRAFSTGSVTGNGLVNVNNTITGAGVIHLTSFDNQSSGLVDANQSEGNWLQIIASTFSNEGALQAESRSVLNLGQDGGTEKLKNSGAINLESEGDLAIAGAYTVTGSGKIGLKGAGAEITSDGSAPATLANESSINAAFSGQIGDQGIFAVNDLTFDNFGTVHASDRASR